MPSSFHHHVSAQAYVYNLFYFSGLMFLTIPVKPSGISCASVVFFCLFAVKQAGMKLALSAEHFIIYFAEDILLQLQITANKMQLF